PQGHVGERWVSSGACYIYVKEKAPNVVKNWRTKKPIEELRIYRNDERKKWRKNNPEKAKEADKKNRENNPEKRAKIVKNWRNKNKDHVRAYDREQLKINLEKRLRVALRTRLNNAIKRNTKSGSAVRDLGCSIEFFISYIENKFVKGMSWNNWGKVWQLDHIKPLCDFDLEDREDCLIVLHCTNFQPLSIEDHKNKTIEDMKIIPVNTLEL